MEQQVKIRFFTLAASFVLLAIAASITSIIINAIPQGPTITYMSNETKSSSAAAMINTTGGSITTIFLNATTQNPRWKAYVGNVTGSLTLDDANDQTIFNWQLANIIGEIYATRYSGVINWSGANCSNLTHISNEEFALNLSDKDDNITKTFSTQTHVGFYIGTRQVLQNTCYSVHTYVNDSPQSSRFEEVALYDGTNLTNGNIIFATPLEQDAYGFDNNTYDFQMIVPENGLPTWTGSTAYYFYVELT